MPAASTVSAGKPIVSKANAGMASLRPLVGVGSSAVWPATLRPGSVISASVPPETLVTVHSYCMALSPR